MSPGLRPDRTHVHERVMRLDGQEVGVIVLHQGTSALTRSAVRSFELVVEARGWTSIHPGAWEDGGGERRADAPGLRAS